VWVSWDVKIGDSTYELEEDTGKFYPHLFLDM